MHGRRPDPLLLGSDCVKRSVKIALCGVLSALSVAVMFCTGFLPTATIALPGLAGCLLIPVVAELGLSWGFGSYAVCGVLSFLLAPDREAALVYILFLGYYPVLYGVLAKIRNRALRWVVKLLLLNAAVGLEVAAAFFLLHLPMETGWLALALWLGVNLTFLLYDVALRRLIDLYFAKLRPRLLKTLHIP